MEARTISIKIKPREFFEIRDGLSRPLRIFEPLFWRSIEKVVTVSRRIDERRRFKSAEKYHSAYLDLYDLPTTTFSKAVKKNERFIGKKINPYFVVLCVYNKKKEILLLNELGGYSEFRLEIDTSKPDKIKDKVGTWSFPGNRVWPHENILECVNRIARDRAGMRVDMVYPLCFIENTFNHGKERVIQTGIAFLAYCRKEYSVERNVKFKWVNDENQIKDMYLGGKDILKYALLKVEDMTIPPCAEIDSQRKANFRYRMHERTVRKLFHNLSSVKLRNKVIETIHSLNPKDKQVKILDVSCGNDEMLIDIANQFESSIVYGNDISWEAICLLSSNDPEERIIFTNHDLQNFPFQEEDHFDFVVCKNTLHHLDPNNIDGVIKNLLKISKTLIILEIEDPKRSIFIARLWNLYFTHFLKDIGTNFYTPSELKSKIRNLTDDDVKLTIDLISTIKGRYMIIVIETGS